MGTKISWDCKRFQLQLITKSKKFHKITFFIYRSLFSFLTFLGSFCLNRLIVFLFCKSGKIKWLLILLLLLLLLSCVPKFWFFCTITLRVHWVNYYIFKLVLYILQLKVWEYYFHPNFLVVRILQWLALRT